MTMRWIVTYKNKMESVATAIMIMDLGSIEEKLQETVGVTVESVISIIPIDL